MAGVLVAACHGGADEQNVEAVHDESELGAQRDPLSWGRFPEPGPTTTDTPIGLAFSIEDGVGTALKVRKGQRFYIDQIDMRASLTASHDEGVAGLDFQGDFAALDWRGIAQVDESFVAEANTDGSYTRRRFYRNARWMNLPSLFVIEQIDGRGRLTALPILVDSGLEQQRFSLDSFFVRRMRAIQWTHDCASRSDCSGASRFEEEALIELRHANGPNPSFKFHPSTTALRVRWSLKPSSPYVIPVEQVAEPEWDYGFSMDLQPLTAPAANGAYAPGQLVSFRLTLKDGSGKRLHPPGQLPSFLDFLAGNTPSGIQYWDVREPYATYYRRKHREKQMYATLSGPVQNARPIRTVVDFATALDFETGALNVGSPSVDGVYGAAATIPSLFQLTDPAQMGVPASDVVSFRLPPDAAAGTYKVMLKARRVYLGEELPRSRVIEVQVGSPQRTIAPTPPAGCNGCHQGGGALSRTLHGLDDMATCSTCHAPLANELEGPVYVRTHFIHSRSKRFGKPLHECKNCHADRASIQRTSKSACLSCHKSYPTSHVQSFGAITDMYIGGAGESFQQCSASCHTNHPGSGL